MEVVAVADDVEGNVGEELGWVSVLLELGVTVEPATDEVLGVLAVEGVLLEGGEVLWDVEVLPEEADTAGEVPFCEDEEVLEAGLAPGGSHGGSVVGKRIPGGGQISGGADEVDCWGWPGLIMGLVNIGCMKGGNGICGRLGGEDEDVVGMRPVNMAGLNGGKGGRFGMVEAAVDGGDDWEGGEGVEDAEAEEDSGSGSLVADSWEFASDEASFSFSPCEQMLKCKNDDPMQIVGIQWIVRYTLKSICDANSLASRLVALDASVTGFKRFLMDPH